MKYVVLLHGRYGGVGWLVGRIVLRPGPPYLTTQSVGSTYSEAYGSAAKLAIRSTDNKFNIKKKLEHIKKKRKNRRKEPFVYPPSPKSALAPVIASVLFFEIPKPIQVPSTMLLSCNMVVTVTKIRKKESFAP